MLFVVVPAAVVVPVVAVVPAVVAVVVLARVAIVVPLIVGGFGVQCSAQEQGGPKNP